MPAAERRGGRDRRGLWALGGLLLIALGLRLARLGFQPLWWDEGYSVAFATLPLAEMLRGTAVDIHPPLYYALLHLWTAWFGTGPAALRAFSILAGLAAVPLAWVLGRRLAGCEAGWGAAVAVACSPFLIYYSQEVRMYALVAALGMGSALAHWDLLRRLERGGRPPGGLWAAYAMLLTGALCTQYYAALLLLAQAAYTVLWAWRAPGRWRSAWGVLAAQGLASLLFAPWVVYAGPKLWLYVQYKVGRDADV
ncbi:MAG: glycosyltransferase family 39 protein, partial [Anaerolineae bacterium]